MKKTFVMTTYWLAVMLIVPMTSVFAESVKIGIIDTQKIIRESRTAKKARTIFLKDVSAKKAELEEKEQQVRVMDIALKENGAKMTTSVRKKKAEQLAREVNELNRLRRDVNEELKKKDWELTREILQEISVIAKEIAKKDNYTIILERRSVVAPGEAIDITDKIISLYDVLDK